MSGRNIEKIREQHSYERNGVTYSSAKPNAFRLAKTMAVCPCINRRSGIIRINWNKLRYLSGLWNASHVMSASCFCSAIIRNVILLGNEYSGNISIYEALLLTLLGGCLSLTVTGIMRPSFRESQKLLSLGSTSRRTGKMPDRDNIPLPEKI